MMREESTYQTLLDAYTQRGHEVLALEQEIAHLRRGVEAYQRMLWETTETPGSTERKMLYAEEMLAWECEDAKRREVGNESRA